MVKIPPTFPLYWRGSKKKSGIARYRKEHEEFVLLLNLLPGIPYYMKAVADNEKGVLYRVEATLGRRGAFAKRLAVGTGEFLRSDPGNITIDIEPFEKTLTMEV